MTNKVTLTNLANLQNETTAVTAINNNNAALITAMNNTLSRDGTAPNQMGATLDMNSNPIINVPDATSTNEAINYGQFVSSLSSITYALTHASLPFFTNVKDFGAKGDGTTDDSAAFSAAETYLATLGGGVLFIPQGSYKISTQRKPSVPIKYVGQGCGGPAGAYASTPPNTVITEILWYGGNMTMFWFYQLNNGCGMQDIRLDGRNLATCCLLVDGTIGGIFERLYIDGATIDTVNFTSTGPTPTTCSWNRASQLQITGNTDGHSCLNVAGDPTHGDACLNNFDNIRISQGGNRHGIALSGDNNIFIMVDIYTAPGGTGYGVYCENVNPPEPAENCFIHIVPGNNGWYQPSGLSDTPGYIFGYAQGQGAAKPTLNGGHLVWMNTQGQIAGLTGFGKSEGSGVNFVLGGTFPSGVTTHTFTFSGLSGANEPDDHYVVFVTPSSPLVGVCVTNILSTGFTVVVSDAPDSDVFLSFLIVRT